MNTPLSNGPTVPNREEPRVRSDAWRHRRLREALGGDKFDLLKGIGALNEVTDLLFPPAQIITPEDDPELKNPLI